jgi:uncharacterized membrane protein YsdA (DUF1294 family)
MGANCAGGADDGKLRAGVAGARRYDCGMTLSRSLLECVAGFYAGMSLVTLAVYAWDKRASKRAGARRIRERTLHLWSIAGGFAGALAGQAFLRHKTRHPSFVVVTTLALAAHAGGWAWWWCGR